MKVEFQKPDNPLQIADLQNLLQSTLPTEKDLVLTLLLVILIFYVNRPGKLHGLLRNHEIYGTGCHNPTSEKTGKTIWDIWRLELTVKHQNGITLTIKYELMQNGYLKAVLKNGPSEKTVAADIFRHKDTTTDANSILIKGGDNSSLMNDLYTLLKEPVETLAAIVVKSVLV